MIDGVRRTPLYQAHIDLGAKMVDFGGWEMPVQYSGIIEEHLAVREQAGLFDVSHMGEIKVEGKQARYFLQNLLTNDLTMIGDNQIQYTLMCTADGGVVDDLLVYRFNEEEYLLVVNAGRIKEDYLWLKEHQIEGVKINDLSSQWAEVALQGPQAEAILEGLTDYNFAELAYFNFAEQVELAGARALISRTGYTGEDGFEIYTQNQDILKIWDTILELGGVPVGLGARDTLRFEAALPLYGHELGLDKNPLEAGLARFVALDKEQFIGQEALQKIEEQGYSRRLVGLEMLERGIPRAAYQLLKEEEVIGEVTTGSYAPTLDKSIALGYVKAEFAKLGTELKVQIRNRTSKAQIVELPFYQREK